MDTTATPLPGTQTQAFFGHPKGLFFLAFTEAWERFSFYGMQGLLVLYMIQQLLLPGHVEHIAGFAQFRAVLESVFGPLSTQALASQIYGVYTGFVYFTPLAGGLIADRWIGQRNAVVVGAISMSAGHIAMAFDGSFLVALLLLVLGSGLLKGNISAQVGALYPVDDEERRTRGFTIFSTGINVGAVLGPLVCGALAQAYGWHAGFGAAALFMLAGLCVYLYGYRYLPARVERSKRDTTALTRADWRVIGALCVVMFITVFQTASYFQLGDVYMVWVQNRVALNLGPFHVPVAWFNSIDSLASIVFVPALFWVWRLQARRGREPHDLAKIGTGAWLAAASYALLAVAIHLSGGALVNVIWPVLTSTGLGIAFLYYWPTLLALVSRAAPASVNATMMGISFMSLFIASLMVGWIGTLYERMTPEQFWWVQAGIAAVGGILVIVLGKRLNRQLHAKETR